MERQKGGFQGRTSDGNPGVEVLWHGIQKLDVAIDMYLNLPPRRAHDYAQRIPTGLPAAG